MQPAENIFPDLPKESRGARKRVRPGIPAYTRRRRRAVGRPQAAAAPESLLLTLWNEHAVKVGICFFWVWFASVNWKGLQQLPTLIWASVSG